MLENVKGLMRSRISQHNGHKNFRLTLFTSPVISYE